MNYDLRTNLDLPTSHTYNEQLDYHESLNMLLLQLHKLENSYCSYLYIDYELYYSFPCWLIIYIWNSFQITKIKCFIDLRPAIRAYIFDLITRFQYRWRHKTEKESLKLVLTKLWIISNNGTVEQFIDRWSDLSYSDQT